MMMIIIIIIIIIIYYLCAESTATRPITDTAQCRCTNNNNNNNNNNKRNRSTIKSPTSVIIDLALRPGMRNTHIWQGTYATINDGPTTTQSLFCTYWAQSFQRQTHNSICLNGLAGAAWHMPN
jgi:hypothetical protein